MTNSEFEFVLFSLAPSKSKHESEKKSKKAN